MRHRCVSKELHLVRVSTFLLLVLQIVIVRALNTVKPWTTYRNGKISSFPFLASCVQRLSLSGVNTSSGGGFERTSVGFNKKQKKNASSASRIKGNKQKSSDQNTSEIATKPSESSNVRHTHQNLLANAESRIDHIVSRIESIDLSPLTHVAPEPKFQQKGQESSRTATGGTNSRHNLDINANGFCVIDNFLDSELISSMRLEAESLLPCMEPSKSTKWDEISQTVVSYDKVNVLSIQVEGGTYEYERTPHLIEYIVTVTSTLTKKLNKILPEIYKLSEKHQTNKLAVCLGDGYSYDKHIDNLGGTDLRKLTALLYLQPPGSHHGQPEFPNEHYTDDQRGGYFRAYDVPEIGDVTCIAPRGDRFLLFWSDSLVHDVSPSFAPNGNTDWRWALTIWFIVATDNPGSIVATDDEITQRHFLERVL